MRQDGRIKAYKKQLEKSGLPGDTYMEDVWQKAKEEGREEKNNRQPLESDKDECQESICTVIDYVLAPALNGFVVWVLSQAMMRGIRRLYFLARDGYFMYRTACRYAESYRLPVECRYLYCSRYSVRIPGYHLSPEKALSYITLGGLDVTAEKLYLRAGFDRERREAMHRAGLLPYGKEEQIPRRELALVKKRLSESRLFMDILKENSRRAQPAYEAYLRQEGLLEEIPAALVDSGWVGSMQKELGDSLKRLGRKKPLSGFYFGLYEVPPEADRSRYHTYFFPPEGEIRRKVLFNNCLFETIFTAPHGMTLSYMAEKEKIKPLLSGISEERKKRLIWMEKRFAAWQETFLRKIFPPGRDAGVSFDRLAKDFQKRETRRAIEKNMELFMHHPTKEEARAFGGMDFTDDILENGGSRIAEELTRKELWENHLISRIFRELLSGGGYVRQSPWYEGSAALREHPGYHIFQYTGYKYLLYYRKECARRKKYGAGARNAPARGT